jgi:hypothetical protein
VVLAVGTAQASILVASLSAVVAHGAAGRSTAPFALAACRFRSTLLGLVFSVFAPAKLLTGLFAGVAAALAVKMASGERLVLARAPLQGLPGHLLPLIVECLRPPSASAEERSAHPCCRSSPSRSNGQSAPARCST